MLNIQQQLRGTFFNINCIAYDNEFDVMSMQGFYSTIKTVAKKTQNFKKLKTLFAQFFSKAYTENDVLGWWREQVK